MITYKYNIYRSKDTKYIDRILRECCFTWNHALALQRRYYKLYGKYISYVRMSNHFTKRIKRNILHSQTRQEVLQRLDTSYSRFFKRIQKRPPKFKRHEQFNSFVFKQGGFVLDGNTIRLNSVNKRLKFSYSRPYEGKVKLVKIKREACGRYSITITTDKDVATKGKSHNGASVGIDFGLKTYLTLSDGDTYASPLFFNKYSKKIKAANRKLSKAQKGSNNRKRRRFELSQVYRKIENSRNDYQWKLANELCRKYDFIFLETLSVEGMKRRWGRKISDLSHSSFVEKLHYEAGRYGVTVHHIDRWYASSKTCECGYVNKSLALKDRTWVCPECGLVNDRDLLAANNILRKGISELESNGKSSAKTRSSLRTHPRIPCL